MSDKYAFADAEYAHHQAAGNAGSPAAPTLTQMLAWLGVSRSGFYEWDRRQPSRAERRREELKIKITALFEASDRTYGYRRIHADLLRGGDTAGPELVRKLMRELGLEPVQPRPYKVTTIRGEDANKPVPDLLNRDFGAPEPGRKLVGDITYIHTWQGWVYLATVIDCFNNELIGWAMADHMRTELVIDALDMAAANHDLDAECIFHSDRGTQYTSADFATALGRLGLKQSLGRTGICYDNALAESVNAIIKNERVNRDTYPTRDKAMRVIAHWIEMVYNRRRISSVLGYRTPHEVRIQHHNTQEAA